MSFSVNHSEANQGANNYLPPDGEYEVIIQSAEQKTTRNGKKLINFTFFIREDVVQAKKGQSFECPMYPLKAPTSRDPEGYKLGTIQAICKGCLIPEGLNFADIDDWLENITDKPCRVEVKHRTYEDRDTINVLYAPTLFPEVMEGTAVNQDDLPFI